MTNEERIAHNESIGYKFVGAGNGFEIYKKPNGVGGWTYLSDLVSLDEGHLPIFDDCVISKEELIIIAKDAYGLELK